MCVEYLLRASGILLREPFCSRAWGKPAPLPEALIEPTVSTINGVPLGCMIPNRFPLIFQLFRTPCFDTTSTATRRSRGDLSQKRHVFCFEASP